jgi:hypothetical protein
VCSVLDSLYTDKESASVYVNADTRLHLAGLMDIVGSFEDVYSELADWCVTGSDDKINATAAVCPG